MIIGFHSNSINQVARRPLFVTTVLLAVAMLIGIASTPATAAASAGVVAEDSVAKDTTPKDGDTLTRPARSLRVWFTSTPVVDKSKLELEGPNGSLEVTGLHTMGDDDLMARVSGAMPDGSYTAKWTFVGSDGKEHTGSWTFEVKRAASD